MGFWTSGLRQIHRPAKIHPGVLVTCLERSISEQSPLPCFGFPVVGGSRVRKLNESEVARPDELGQGSAQVRSGWTERIGSLTKPPHSLRRHSPEYLSGHSTFSAAAAEVLKRLPATMCFQKSVVFKAGSSLLERGLVPTADLILSWSSFSEMADEAGMSRRYGGIHFAEADVDGRKLGRQVGVVVQLLESRLARLLLSATAASRLGTGLFEAH